MEQNIKIGTVVIPESKLMEIIKDKKYVVTSSRIYRVTYSERLNKYRSEVVYLLNPWTKRRETHYRVMSGTAVNRMLNRKYRKAG